MQTLDRLEIDKVVHRQCRSCFMTGKACMHERLIKEDLDRAEKKQPGGADDRRKGNAFVIMPFSPLITEVYETQIRPLLDNYFRSVVRADDAQRTGYIVCEKICRPIQSSQLVAAEISANNQNVFYELGLAYALGLPVAIFLQRDRVEAQTEVVKSLALGGCVTAYDPFGDLEPSKVNIWQRKQVRKGPPQLSRKGDIPPIVAILADTSKMVEKSGDTTLNYSVNTYCESQIRLALAKAMKDNDKPERRLEESLEETAENRRTSSPQIDDPLRFFHASSDVSTFQNIEEAIDTSKCVIVCTSRSDPMSYFWLGFAHGSEKTVVPITALPGPEERSMAGRCGDMELPFDVRALWHIHFQKDDPRVLQRNLVDILRVVLKDEAIAHRRDFWRDILEESRVSLFVGSVELQRTKKESNTPTQEKPVRHVVGEWDYRTMAELCGFLVRLKETADLIIEPPTFRATEANASLEELKIYADGLAKKLKTNSAIVIATPDSNDMTEVALATRAGKIAFSAGDQTYASTQSGKPIRDRDFCGIVAVKKESDLGKSKCIYYEFENPEDAKETRTADSTPERQTQGKKRGFRDYYLRGFDEYLTDYDDYRARHEGSGITYYFGHIMKYRQGSERAGDEPSRRDVPWTIVIQGITGPATLGLAQILTGAHYKQFTIFDESVDSGQWKTCLNSVKISIEKEEARNDTAGAGLSHRAKERIAPLEALLEKAAQVERKVREEAQLGRGQRGGQEVKSQIATAVEEEAKAKALEVLREGLERHAEEMARKLNETCEKQGSVEAIVKVYVSDCPEQPARSMLEPHDERRVIWWDFEIGFPRIAIAHHEHQRRERAESAKSGGHPDSSRSEPEVNQASPSSN